VCGVRKFLESPMVLKSFSRRGSRSEVKVPNVVFAPVRPFTLSVVEKRDVREAKPNFGIKLLCLCVRCS